MYIPHTTEDIEKARRILGIKEIDDIFREITNREEFFDPKELGKPLPQQKIIDYFENRSNIKRYKYFVGSGAYDHFIPPIVDSLVRSEFLTSYTPYQAEVSQGVLKIIWDFQSLICEILDQDVCNSSHYDGATAAAEAVLMAKRIYSKINENANKFLIANSVHPTYLNVIQTYTSNLNLHPVFIEFDEKGKLNIEKLMENINEDVFAVVIQSPNFFGVIEEDVSAIKNIVGDKITVLITTNPFVYFLIHPSGGMGAPSPKVDIVAANLQPFGIPLSFGGPYLGVIATRMEHIRNLPGRIIGQTVDKDGKTAYTMILQTREQHIRREKATSNICTNQGLMAIRNTIYLMSMGKDNLIKIAQKNYTNIRFLMTKINEEKLGKVVFENVFNEALFYIPNYTKVYKEIKDKCNVIFGINLSKFKLHKEMIDNLRKVGINHHLDDLAIICTTEKYSKQEINEVLDILKEISFQATI